MNALFWVLDLISLTSATAAIYMALIEAFPLKWLHVHYFIRKQIVWSILGFSSAFSVWLLQERGSFPLGMIPHLLLNALAVVLTYRMHQDTAFPAVDFPEMAEDPFVLPIRDDAQMALIEYGSESKAYPLDWLIHHHIVNDRFGDRIVALTYCAMCRSIIPFDVTELGPLFVGSFKNANMVVADRRTKTFFQQATFESIVGQLHPASLRMIPFTICTWKDLKEGLGRTRVVEVSEKDFRDFQLPIPRVWKRILASEATPGLSSKNRDHTLPARTMVIGLLGAGDHVCFLKEELIARRVFHYEKGGIFIDAAEGSVAAFRDAIGKTRIVLEAEAGGFVDRNTGTRWRLGGTRIEGPVEGDLVPFPISEEYWFSWKKFHPDTDLLRLGSDGPAPSPGLNSERRSPSEPGGTNEKRHP